MDSEPARGPESPLGAALVAGGLIVFFALFPEAKTWLASLFAMPWISSVLRFLLWVLGAAVVVELWRAQPAGRQWRAALLACVLPCGVLLLTRSPERYAAPLIAVVQLGIVIWFGRSAWVSLSRWPLPPMRRASIWVAAIVCGLLSFLPLSQGNVPSDRMGYLFLASVPGLAAWLLMPREPLPDDASEVCVLAFGSGLWLAALTLTGLGSALFAPLHR